jgi:serine/threonine-protein kinase
MERLKSALADRYTIEHELGAGGMATVYLAHDIKHDRKVALKVLKPDLAAVLGAERFVQEIKTTANLQHPHILPLFDSGEADSFLYYVMPFIDGETLRDKLNRETQLGIDEAVGITTAIADALDYAHRHNVIHRDIKPENILLHDGRPMVADFGIALAVSAAAGGRMTETGLSLGTPHYMSPEQATAEKDLTNRSDIYSLGCVLYEMLTGDPPHTGSSAQAIIMKIVTDEARPVTELRKSVPPHVAASLGKALEKLSADRFESAAKFGEALTNPAFTLPTTQAAVVAAPARGPWNRVSITATALAGIMLVTALWGWLRPLPTPAVARFTLKFAEGEGVATVMFGPHLAIAPDGSRFVYVGEALRSDGRLWTHVQDQLASTALQGTEGACCPAFSPDGQSIAFRQDFVAKVIPFGGGASVTLYDSTFTDVNGIDWGPDGFVYIASQGILRVPETGGELKVVVPADSLGRRHSWVDVLPNGKGVLFALASNPNRSASTIHVADLGTGEVHELTQGMMGRYTETGHLLYVRPDGTLMAAPFDLDRLQLTGTATPMVEGLQPIEWGAVDFAVSRNGTLLYRAGGEVARQRIVWVNRDGVAQPVDPEWTGNFLSLALSPDGRWLAVGIDAGSQLWIKDLQSGSLSRLTFEGITNFRPTWTPDGRSVLFVSVQTQGADLWIQRADGSRGAELLLDRERNVFEGIWSKDEEWLIFRTDNNDPGRGDILAVRTADSAVVELLASPDAEESSPALSPDGRWLAYVSDESGRHEVYVRPFPNVDEARWLVSAGGGSEPLWSHSGRELFYRNGNNDMVAVEILAGPTFARGEPRVLFSMRDYPSVQNHPNYDVGPNDQRFIMIQLEESDVESDVVMVLNWFEELKAKVGRE